MLQKSGHIVSPSPSVKETLNVTSGVSRWSSAARREMAVAIFLTAVLVIVHLWQMLHAGALWRDEAGLLAVAKQPSTSDVLASFQYEGFPPAVPLLIRGFAAVAGTNDIGFRILGCVIGLTLIAMLWIVAAVTHRKPPTISLGLVGFNVAAVRWCDSLRGYGLGTILLLAAYVLICRAAKSTTVRNVLLAGCAAICSVQILFHNSVLIAVFTFAAVLVALSERSWRRAAVAAAIGSVAAISVFPYLPRLHSSRSWDSLVRDQDYGLVSFFKGTRRTIGDITLLPAVCWAVLIATAIVLCCRSLARKRSPEVDPRVGLYTAAVLVGAPVAYFTFLKILSYPTQPWYYLAMLVVLGVSVESALGIQNLGGWARGSLILCALMAAASNVAPMLQEVSKPRTNVDQVASALKKNAGPNDLVLVSSWEHGISFARYYHGAAPWMTLPDVPFHKFHRYDLLQSQVARTNQMDCVKPLLERASATISSNNRVWLVWGAHYRTNIYVAAGIFNHAIPQNHWKTWDNETAWATALWFSLSRNAAYEFQEVKLSGVPKSDDYERTILYVVGNGSPTNVMPASRDNSGQISRSSLKHEDTGMFTY